jgi:hypothetical protein
MRFNPKLLLLALVFMLLFSAALSLQAQTAVPTVTPSPTFVGGGGGGGGGGPSNPQTIKPIEYSQTVEGVLDTSTFTALYTFRGQQGDAVTIRMSSVAFNAYLTLIDSFGSEIAWDDDGAGYPDSLLGPYILPQTGDYQIRASSYDYEPRGSFTLRLDKVDVQNLTFGDTTDVTFTERDSAAYFVFEGKAGDVLSITVNSGGDLDTRLRVRGRGDSYDLMADDDSGAGFDPEISRLIIPYDNQYVIAVETFAPGQTGTVKLSVGTSDLASLDDSPQTVTLGNKRSQDVLTFEGKAGERVRINVVVTSGRTDYMTTRVTQNGQELTYISSSYLAELSFALTTPYDGRVNVQLENYTNVVLEVTLEREE